MLRFNSNPGLAEAKLGISLAWSGLDSRNVAECLELPGLEAASIPAEALSHTVLKRIEGKRPDVELHAGRIIDQAVSQNILYAPAKMRDAFAQQVAELTEAASEKGFKSASLDLGLETALEDAHLRAAALDVMRRIAPTLVKREIKLLLPCRAPGLGAPGYPATLARFIQDCMVPKVKVSLEAHPHELPQGFSPAELSRGLEFDVALATLMFNADAGSRIVKGHIEPWAVHLGRHGFKGPYLLCPKSGDKARIPAECESLLKFIASIRQSAASSVS